ncbi:MAG TPA: hypothetical protein VNB64_00705 [Solirubrobacteraceae bacterium]|nr:hypothetical protein [Solirubrobacteraceae bacterium]
MRPGLAAALLAAAALSACGGGGGSDGGGGAGAGESRTGELVWEREPLVFRVRRIPTDRVLVGRVRNDSLRPLDIRSADVGVRDGGGRRLRSFAQFTESYVHGIYPAYQKPDPLPADEQERLGLIVRILPGDSAPLVVSYRTTPRDRGRLRVEWKRGSLPVPTRLREQAS